MKIESNDILVVSFQNNTASREYPMATTRMLAKCLTEGGKIENYHDVVSCIAEKGRYELTWIDNSGTWTETGTYIQRKWAVFGWRRSGNDSYAIMPVGFFSTAKDAAIEFNRLETNDRSHIAEVWV